MNEQKMAQRKEFEEVMEYVLLCSSIDGTEKDAHKFKNNLWSLGIKTPRQLNALGINFLDELLNDGDISRVQHQQLCNLIRWMRSYVTQDGIQHKWSVLSKPLQEWEQTLTRETFKDFMKTGEIHLPPPHDLLPKFVINTRSAPDPPGYHIDQCNSHTNDLMDDPMPTFPARTTDPGEDKPNLPGIWKKTIQEKVPTLAPTTLAPIPKTKARPTPSPTTVMSHPTWEYWCHTSTPFRGAYPSYDDDYCNNNSPPTMTTPTPVSISDICIIGDPPYQLRGG